MIVGIGTDICGAARVAEAIGRRGQTILDRLFSAAEQALAVHHRSPNQFYAGRFAAKEACAKSLGTGITDRVRWTDIEILARRSGQPYCELSGGAARRAKRLVGKGFVPKLHVSIAHDGEFAQALVILEAWLQVSERVIRFESPSKT
ncbi:holo-ACP synthase [Inquilinus limosus]|uniref:holo-ACP synthase n=1 Tax=Inquilinus limosus TaxID=171674 RepID=UPI0009DCFB01